MKMIRIIFGLILLIVGGFLLKLFVFVPKEFQPQTNAVSHCPSDVFDKSAVVFDVLTICATSGVPQEKLQHAASVAAQWLDNNQDGIPDNPLVNQKLAENKATLIMSSKGFGLYGGKIYDALIQAGHFIQDLHAIETNNPTRRDASQEEIHHLVVGAGWASAYPEIFNDRSTDSAIYKAWQIADKHQYYQYNDPTCDTACKVMEFVYKSTAAYLGATSDLADDEFTIKTRSGLTEKLPAIVDIYESDRYEYPRALWPDGNYPFTDTVIQYFSANERQNTLTNPIDQTGSNTETKVETTSGLMNLFSESSRWPSEGADITASDGETLILTTDSKNLGGQALEAWKLYHKPMPYNQDWEFSIQATVPQYWNEHEGNQQAQVGVGIFAGKPVPEGISAKVFETNLAVVNENFRFAQGQLIANRLGEDPIDVSFTQLEAEQESVTLTLAYKASNHSLTLLVEGERVGKSYAIDGSGIDDWGLSDNDTIDVGIMGFAEHTVITEHPPSISNIKHVLEIDSN